jgi:hypothetical protein
MIADQRPIAVLPPHPTAGCVGQVHRAVLRPGAAGRVGLWAGEGREVVVKVLHPRVSDTIAKYDGVIHGAMRLFWAWEFRQIVCLSCAAVPSAMCSEPLGERLHSVF